MKWREKKVIACQDGWSLSATWGRRDVGDFYPEAQRVSPGTAQNNPLWQFERKTGRTRIKIKENGTRWLNGRWAAGAVLHANGSRSGVRFFFFVLGCIGSGAQSPFREAQLNVPVCRNANKESFMYAKSLLFCDPPHTYFFLSPVFLTLVHLSVWTCTQPSYVWYIIDHLKTPFQVHNVD